MFSLLVLGSNVVPVTKKAEECGIYSVHLCSRDNVFIFINPLRIQVMWGPQAHLNHLQCVAIF